MHRPSAFRWLTWGAAGLAAAVVLTAGAGGLPGPGLRRGLLAAPPNPAAPPETASIELADGFDFPVGRPDAVGYYKARGFRPNGHLGEDWNGRGGGNTDLGDPVYAAGHGLVVWARDVRLGWGNVVIIRHEFREGSELRTVDSLYGHLDRILVREGQPVRRGEQVGTIGTAHGIYEAHLHFEVRKNILIGMNRSLFARDFSNYFDPTQFIASHRSLPQGGGRALVAVNTFAPYGGGGALPARDAAYELGSGLAGPTATVKPLGRSAYQIKRRTPAGGGHRAFDDLNHSFHVDRYGDLPR